MTGTNGAKAHVELFERFTAAVGAKEEVQSRATSGLIATYDELAGRGARSGLAGFVASSPRRPGSPDARPMACAVIMASETMPCLSGSITRTSMRGTGCGPGAPSDVRLTSLSCSTPSGERLTPGGRCSMNGRRPYNLAEGM